MTPFPWAEAMQFGLGVLRLPPDQFWRMTPRELAAAIAGLRGGGISSLGRAAFDELMRCYPDHEEPAQ
ncbi:hypothetical protein DNX69_07535 [Rhodopseudomonas palustris]|uniref:Phage tail assembly chaperone n=1 Tax=Rhodopseudomonas palustris TaxID=1076 RepID=A0A323UJ54_RHOPL|nr:rcc01693 family protein [Rhodopseudomonas palustris]PZA12735.1 hypothetical protein DNX69_07535 [Rhodopseudomonas palustris]